jgi:hypothetical protein
MMDTHPSPDFKPLSCQGWQSPDRHTSINLDDCQAAPLSTRIPPSRRMFLRFGGMQTAGSEGPTGLPPISPDPLLSFSSFLAASSPVLPHHARVSLARGKPHHYMTFRRLSERNINTQ